MPRTHCHPIPGRASGAHVLALEWSLDPKSIILCVCVPPVAAIVMQQTEPQTVESLQVHALNWKPHSLHLTSGFL